MKYQLETIPIWDAYKKETECPLCLLEAKAEKNYINFFLGSSIMNPEMRVKVNETGFCPSHYRKLFDARENRHGLGLMTNTYLHRQKELLDKPRKELGKLADSAASEGTVKGLLQHKKSLKEAVKTYRDRCAEAVRSCMICTRIDNTLARYAFTIVYLWKKDGEFRAAFRNSKGFCLFHLPRMLDMAGETLNNKQLGEWLSVTLSIQQDRWEALDRELYEFTQSYAYDHDASPQKDRTAALADAIQKLTGTLFSDRK
jgi:hypothetical protein